VSVTAPEVRTGFAFGPVFNITAPGDTSGSGLSYTLNNVRPVDAGCSITLATQLAFASMQLRTGTTPLDYPSCRNGFVFDLVATRLSNSALSATCTVNVTIAQVIKAPVISDCGPRAVDERSAAGTVAGLPLAASTTNVGTALLWSINGSASAPFSIGVCDAILRTTAPLRWATNATVRVPITVTNDGTSLGIGTAASTCTATVNVRPVYLPPVVRVTSLSVSELSAVGTAVGNVVAQDPEGFAITRIAFSAVDTPDAFAIDSQGNVTVKAVVDSLVSLKSLFRYTVNVSNAYTSAVYPITITLLPVPRPPVILDQARSVREDAVAGTTLPPALNASHPQNTPYTFSLVNNTAFVISSTGVVSV
jgi:hypothetical protein